LGLFGLVSVAAQAMCGIGEPELQITPKIGLRTIRQHPLADLALWPIGVELTPAIGVGRLCNGDTVMRPLHTCHATPGKLRKIYKSHNLSLYQSSGLCSWPHSLDPSHGAVCINVKNSVI
jgi:hypothetical protein